MLLQQESGHKETQHFQITEKEQKLRESSMASPKDQKGSAQMAPF